MELNMDANCSEDSTLIFPRTLLAWFSTVIHSIRRKEKKILLHQYLLVNS